MTFRTMLAVTLVAPFPLMAATADPTATFTSAWIIGDSLSDDGNLFAATSAAPGVDPQPASPPYFAGRFSNGPVWAETVTGAFDAAGLPTGNVAFGGARTDGGDIPDLGDQLAFVASRSSAFGDRPFAAVWIGANDLFAGIAAGTGEAAALAAAGRVGAGIDALEGLGFDDVVVFNLPDLGATPLYTVAQPEAREAATAATALFNDTLDAVIAAEAEVAVSLVDAASLFDDLVADPAAFGITDPLALPCLDASTGTVCSADEARGRAFFDLVHPTATIHDAVAREASAVIAQAAAPIPLPAGAPLLLAALAALGAVRVASRRA